MPCCVQNGTDAGESVCVLSQVATFIQTSNSHLPFFGVALFYANLLFLLTYLGRLPFEKSSLDLPVFVAQWRVFISPFFRAWNETDRSSGRSSSSSSNIFLIGGMGEIVLSSRISDPSLWGRVGGWGILLSSCCNLSLDEATAGSPHFCPALADHLYFYWGLRSEPGLGVRPRRPEGPHSQDLRPDARWPQHLG